MKLIADITAKEMIRILSYLGEQCIVKIRDRSGDESWYDQTGNLRSSIGYAVFAHGQKVIQSAFNAILQGATGAATGKRYIDALAARYAATTALVVVAGMEYADFVEAKSNKDVLANTHLWALSVVDKYLAETRKRIESKISRI